MKTNCSVPITTITVAIVKGSDVDTYSYVFVGNIKVREAEKMLKSMNKDIDKIVITALIPNKVIIDTTDPTKSLTDLIDEAMKDFKKDGYLIAN